jgi:peptide/nickel transport system permease protein
MQSGIWAYLARRAIFLVPLLLGLSILMFLLIHAAPGDPVLAMMGERAASNPTYVEQTRKNLGLDKPLPVQYFYWLRRIVLHGDLGTAYTFNNKPVLTLIGERFWSTVQLQAIALLLGLAIAIPVGIISATRQYSTIDNTVTVGSFLGLALPNFWLALLLQVWIGVKLGWLPVISTGQADADYPGRIKYFIMPVIVLALPNIAYFARFMRSSMLEVINQDYVTVARAKGLDHQRCRDHRADLRLARARRSGLQGNRSARLPGHPGGHAPQRSGRHGRQSLDRPHLRPRRPARLRDGGKLGARDGARERTWTQIRRRPVPSPAPNP